MKNDLSAGMATVGATLVMCSVMLLIFGRIEQAAWSFCVGCFAAILSAATNERNL